MDCLGQVTRINEDDCEESIRAENEEGCQGRPLMKRIKGVNEHESWQARD